MIFRSIGGSAHLTRLVCVIRGLGLTVCPRSAPATREGVSRSIGGGGGPSTRLTLELEGHSRRDSSGEFDRYRLLGSVGEGDLRNLVVVLRFR